MIEGTPPLVIDCRAPEGNVFHILKLVEERLSGVDAREFMRTALNSTSYRDVRKLCRSYLPDIEFVNEPDD